MTLLPTQSASLSIVPMTTKVVLVGTSKCERDQENFPELSEVLVNLQTLRRLLTDPTLVGIPNANIISFENEAHQSELAEKLWIEAESDADTFILYYAGHGTVGEDSTELLLAVGNTTHRGREANALPASAIRKTIRRSTASNKILVIDSCFSGRMLDSMSSQPEFLRAKIDVKGTFAVASAPPNGLAKAHGINGCTAFTGELARVLQHGLPNGPQVLTLEAIFNEVRRALRDSFPEPQVANWQEAAKLGIAYNRGYQPPLLQHWAIEPERDITILQYGPTELSLVTYDKLREVTRAAISDAFRNGCRSFVIDIRNVAFMDSSGVSLIFGHVVSANMRKCNIYIVVDHKTPVTELLLSLNVGKYLPLVESLDEAIASLRGQRNGPAHASVLAFSSLRESYADEYGFGP
jgi:anti-anti-sigma factor